jgi:putative phage-type endonuclease
MLSKDQLEAHYSGIGGSSAVAVLGLDPYSSNIDVYLKLTDDKYRFKQQNEINSKLAVRIGNSLESLVAEIAENEKGWQLKKCEGTLRDQEYPFLIGHYDRFIVNENAVLEIKTRGMYGSRGYGYEDTDQILDCEYIQMQHYINLTNAERAHLAVLMLATQEIKYFVIDRNDEIINAMRTKLAQFWFEHVEPRIPPAPTTYKDACTLWPYSISNPVTATDEMLALVKEIKSLTKNIKEQSEVLDYKKAQVAGFLKESNMLLDLTGKSLLTYKTQNSSRISPDLLRAKYPDIAKEVTNVGTSRVMRLMK